jgi:hypothetical protein
MYIEHPHDLGREEAIERIDDFLEGLMRRQQPGGITITNPEKRWDGNTMDFSFTAAKGLFGASIRGLLRVEDDHVIMEVDLPPLVRSFVGEDRIRDAVSRELGRLLDGRTA